MSEYDLIFEGGGAKGSVFVGALKAFADKGHQPRRVIGTSAGAITATLLAAGFTPDEMKDVVNERLNGRPRFASFMDNPKVEDFSQEDVRNSDTKRLLNTVNIPMIPELIEDGFSDQLIKALMLLPQYRQLFSLAECGGVFSGNTFLAWVKEKLALKGFDPEVTLLAFQSHPNVKNELSLVASDTSNGGEMLVLNHRTAPHCPVAWAVRMSMSIPFVWREVIWKAEWGTYLDRPMSGHTIVDGGVLSNFPIALVNKQPILGSHEWELMGDTPANAAGTLGFLIDESLVVPGQPEQSRGGFIGELKIIRRITRLVDTMTGARDNIEIRKNENLVCRLPAAGYGTTEFDMDSTRLDALIQAGFDATMEHPF